MFSQKLKWNLTALSLVLIISGCGGSGSRSENTDSAAPAKPSDPYEGLTADKENGIYLYNFRCAGCHGNKAAGGFGPNIQGKKPADIRKALNTVPNMSYLPKFTDQQLVNIASYLAELKVLADAPKQSLSTAITKAENTQIPVSGLPAYAEVSVVDSRNIVISYQQHSPQQTLQSLQLTSGDFRPHYPLSIQVTDQITMQQQQQTIWVPQAVNFGQHSSHQ